MLAFYFGKINVSCRIAGELIVIGSISKLIMYVTDINNID